MVLEATSLNPSADRRELAPRTFLITAAGGLLGKTAVLE
jgi:hypothetical protein